MKKIFVLLTLAAITFSSCKKSEDNTTYNPAKDGIVGEWYSAGSDVAYILNHYFGIDSIYVKFNEDQTYIVKSFVDGTPSTPLTGTYTQTKPTTGTIWEIVLEQGAPTTLTSEGIFEIDATADPYTMQYEVAQTSPVQAGVTPPTVEGGFGSTSGGAYGTTNIQKYKRISK